MPTKINYLEMPGVMRRNLARTACKAVDRFKEDQSKIEQFNRQKSSKEDDSLAHFGKANNCVANTAVGNSYTDCDLQ